MIPFHRRSVVVAALLVCTGCSSPAPSPPASTPPPSSPAATTTTTTSAAPTTTVPVVVPATTTTDDPVPVVALGEYCSPAGATATTSDGSTAYCSRLAGTDSYQWDLSPGVVPNPRLTPTATPVVAVGSYCPTPNATATTPDGSTVYCERVQATDGYQWSLTPGLIPNPRLTTTTAASSPSAGDDCYDPDGVAVDAQGRTLYCNPTVNGRLAGNLLYQLQP